MHNGTAQPRGCGNGNDAEDLCLLQQYFAGYPVTISEDIADADEDGRLTRRDSMILARYLGGWDNYVLPYSGN